MNQQRFAGREEPALRRYEYDDSHVIAADLGLSEEQVDIDIVGDTAILVVETDGDVSETEIDLPGRDGEATVNNGVLTVTVQK